MYTWIIFKDVNKKILLQNLKNLGLIVILISLFIVSDIVTSNYMELIPKEKCKSEIKAKSKFKFKSVVIAQEKLTQVEFKSHLNKEVIHYVNHLKKFKSGLDLNIFNQEY